MDSSMVEDLIVIEGRYYIGAHSSLADVQSRVLKYGDTFALFDRHGDIRPLGFDLIEMDGQVTCAVVDRVATMLKDKAHVVDMTAHNFALGRQYFSYEAIKPKLDKIIGILQQQDE